MFEKVKAFFKRELGSVNIGGIMMLGIGMLMAAVGAYFIQPLLAGFDDARTANNISSFTATATVVKIGPTLIILGYIIAVGVVGFMGIKMVSGK